MQQESSECVPLETLCSKLSSHDEVRRLLKDALGGERLTTALALMEEGRLEGLTGGEVHDLLVDAIINNSTVSWSGIIHQPHDNYSVVVNEYCGVFWVYATDYNPVGYFLSQSEAIHFIISNWENVS